MHGWIPEQWSRSPRIQEYLPGKCQRGKKETQNQQGCKRLQTNHKETYKDAKCCQKWEIQGFIYASLLVVN